MPNQIIHVPAGVGAGLAVSKAWQSACETDDPTWYYIGTVLGGALGGRWADVVDPPGHPNHRGTGHSKILNALGIMGLTSLILIFDGPLGGLIEEALENKNYFLAGTLQFNAGFLRGFIGGQVSHLALDAMTPKGLPY